MDICLKYVMNPTTVCSVILADSDRRWLCWSEVGSRW